MRRSKERGRCGDGHGDETVTGTEQKRYLLCKKSIKDIRFWLEIKMRQFFYVYFCDPFSKWIPNHLATVA
jgi:hypothetical protein